MKRLLITAALLMVLGATSAALGAGSSPITENVLGAAGISRPYTIPVTSRPMSSSPRRRSRPARALVGITTARPSWSWSSPER
jgi:hypothetical protein